MDRKLSEWKLGVDRIWLAATPDYAAALRIVAEIADASEETLLRQAARQALPSLRNASPGNVDGNTRDAARRRLRVVHEVLHTLASPRFGRREASVKVPTSEERYRQLLELPLDRRLSAAEIHRAYKHIAKRAHPDAGGSAGEFLELAAAREALMKQK
ncbi:MAG: hypothetical protein WDN50_15000 [Bradyrhizobium sp.]